MNRRSSSTPCLSTSWKDLQQDDWSGPIEILGFSEHFAEVKQMVNDIVKAMRIFNVDDGVDGNKNQQRIHVSKIASLQQVHNS
ncbi:hypothetical protein OIU84_002806 [Salix udensis]|uniref:Uncharacterized protein n=1 Tax=Salix udensis TaxID=889485 RepID=A0AAD6K6X7_9ROSI|nr:hypothetical protein OIU84_002806 [Salix udensis]